MTKTHCTPHSPSVYLLSQAITNALPAHDISLRHRVTARLYADIAIPDLRVAIVVPDSRFTPTGGLPPRDRLNHLVAHGWRVFLFTSREIRYRLQAILQMILGCHRPLALPGVPL